MKNHYSIIDIIPYKQQENSELRLKLSSFRQTCRNADVLPLLAFLVAAPL
jgi:hypothetical protein